MISSDDFDFFLQHGFIQGLELGTSMNVLLDRYGADNWYVKHIENNGLIYGIIKIGFIEFHIYDEQINGISYRPDLPFPRKDFKGVAIPWIYKNEEISKVESQLLSRGIGFNQYTVQHGGDRNVFKTAGADMFLDEGEHVFIDTVGGVTFLFEINDRNDKLEAYQICKYYDIHKSSQ
jgi:hypothetical protein